MRAAIVREDFGLKLDLVDNGICPGRGEGGAFSTYLARLPGFF